MKATGVPVRRWTRLEYERLVEQDFFGPDERLELIDGALIVKEPQTSGHFTAVALVHDALRNAFGAGWFVRLPGPVALDESSEPEPDISVVPGVARTIETPTRPGRSLSSKSVRAGFASIAPTRRPSTRARASPTTGS